MYGASRWKLGIQTRLLLAKDNIELAYHYFTEYFPDIILWCKFIILRAFLIFPVMSAESCIIQMILSCWFMNWSCVIFNFLDSSLYPLRWGFTSRRFFLVIIHHVSIYEKKNAEIMKLVWFGVSYSEKINVSQPDIFISTYN